MTFSLPEKAKLRHQRRSNVENIAIINQKVMLRTIRVEPRYGTFYYVPF